MHQCLISIPQVTQWAALSLEGAGAEAEASQNVPGTRSGVLSLYSTSENV